MLDDMCAECKNYFIKDILVDDYKIEDGNLVPPVVTQAKYIRIVGSLLNDGVYEVSKISLTDEDTFHGAVWVMAVPADFEALCAEITAWQEANGGATSVNMSPFQSESFGGYTYSKSAGSSASGKSTVPTWQSIYASRLNKYRRVRIL